MVRPSSRPEVDRFRWVGDDQFDNEFEIGCCNDTVKILGILVLGAISATSGTFSEVVNLNGGSVSKTKSSGGDNEAYGDTALGAITIGGQNTAVGSHAGANLTEGQNNIFYGFNAGLGIITGLSNVAIGANTLTSVDGDNQVAIGDGALRYTEGADNMGIGKSAVAGSPTVAHTGENNIGIGLNTLLVIQGNTWNNTAIGNSALTALTIGVGNTCIGKDTGKAVTEGSGNIFIGNGTGDTTTIGDSNILIGSGMLTDAVGSTGQLKIHFSGGANTPIIIGDMAANINKLGCNYDAVADLNEQFNIKVDSTAAMECMELEQLDVSEGYINFKGTSDTSTVNPITSWTTGNSIQGFVRVEINGTDRWMPFYDAPTS